MWADIALILGAYLLGSAPHLSALAKLRHANLDGDFHASLWQRGGRLTGVIGILGEFAKGAIPVLIGKGLGFSLSITALAGVAAVCGQMWPVFSRFDGEKGNSVGIAMAAALVPKPILIALVPIVVALIVRTVPRLLDTRKSPNTRPILGGSPSRSLPLGMAAGFLILPVASWWLGEPLVIILSCSALFILIMIRRLTAGLKSDLKASTGLKGILIRRLFYDRATAEWRQELIAKNAKGGAVI